ncbi:hypothetical protein [Xenorhabdus littoralis]|uniref:hypothetical protein n=1 Tax=Xenorhabdus littoralis TaxID=2582835 RepID=UPI0029E7E50F|nr:hypothetical protein [Xenorhabdus sp. psl]MDX7990284.1 hypothetical protein [Xenorhabdus sp. psl]
MNRRVLTSVYKPEIAKSKLTKHFGDKLPLIDISNNLTDIGRITLAAMCDGHKITSSGNNVPADFEVTRAPAIVDSLVNDFNLPITRQRIDTISGTGNKAYQSIYYIQDNALKELLDDPDTVLSRNRKENSLKAWSRSERELQRLVKELGGEEVLSYVKDIMSSKDTI